MSALERSEQAMAWELRGLWAAGKTAVLTLSARCMVGRVEGLVQYVAVTGAYAVVDGWHIPCADVLAIHKPHHSQHQKFAPGSQASDSITEVA